MTQTETAIVEALRKLAKRVADNELEMMALRSLLKTKGVFTTEEWERILQIAYAAREEDHQRADQSPAQENDDPEFERLRRLLESFDGPKQ